MSIISDGSRIVTTGGEGHSNYITVARRGHNYNYSNSNKNIQSNNNLYYTSDEITIDVISRRVKFFPTIKLITKTIITLHLRPRNLRDRSTSCKCKTRMKRGRARAPCARISSRAVDTHSVMQYLAASQRSIAFVCKTRMKRGRARAPCAPPGSATGRYQFKSCRYTHCHAVLSCISNIYS